MSYRKDVEDFLKEIENYAEKETRGRLGYRGLKPEGTINLTKFSHKDHKDFNKFVNDRGYSLGMYYYGMTRYILSKTQEEIPDLIDEAKILLIPDIDSSKEKVLSWLVSLSTQEQKDMEELFMWHYKIVRAVTQGEKDLDNWQYIGRKY